MPNLNLKVVLVVEAPVDILGVDAGLAMLFEFTESLQVSFLFLLPSTDDLLSGDFSKYGFPFLDFEVGHAVGVSKAGE